MSDFPKKISHLWRSELSCKCDNWLKMTFDQFNDDLKVIFKQPNLKSFKHRSHIYHSFKVDSVSIGNWLKV